MIGRLVSIPLLLWGLGFALFAVTLPKAWPDRVPDGIVVLTGGAGRIQRGLQLLEAGQAERMLVSGVDRRVQPHELALAYDAPLALFERKIDLGNESVDTRSNALEAAQWVARYDYGSVRLVTTDWHMPRARFELASALGPDVEILTDAVPSQPGFGLLFREYNKYLLRHAAALFGI